MKKFLYLSLLLWVVFPCIVFIIWGTGHELLIGTRGTAFFIQGILNYTAALSGIALEILHYCKTPKAVKNRAALSLITVCIAVLLLCGNFFCTLMGRFEEYHSFSSPDKTHSIVIMENVSLISGQVTLYERVSPFLISRKAYIITDDGYRPVCAGKYTLEWQENMVILTVFNGAGEQKTISATLKEL